MEHYRRTAQTRLGIGLRLVWITKCRKRSLRGDVGPDHVHPFASCPPQVSASDLMRRVEGEGSRRLVQEHSRLKKPRRGRPPRARGSFVARWGGVTAFQAVVVQLTGVIGVH